MSAPSLFTYVRRAFLFRPPGMFVAPNLVLVTLFVMVGFLQPGLWLLGLSVELAVLLAFVTNGRFRGMVDREHGLLSADEVQEAALARAVGRLSPSGKARYEAQLARCEALLERSALEHHGVALSGLLQVYLQLLSTRQLLSELVAGAERGLPERRAELDRRLAEATDPALQQSLGGQVGVIARRIEHQAQAVRRLEFVDGELQRVEDQVELLREQSLLDATGPAATRELDHITGALDATRRWLAEEEQEVAPAAPAPRLAARGRVTQ